jgi:hypothetical protein
MLGGSLDATVEQNIPASLTMEDSGPRRSRDHSVIVSCVVTTLRKSLVSLVVQFRAVVGWSCSPRPTFFASMITGTPISRRWSAGPIPEIMSNWGEAIVPAQSSISRSALTECSPVVSRYLTPVATPSSITI